MTRGRKNKHVFIDGVEAKKCSTCRKDIPLANFYKKEARWDGLSPCCKQCCRRAEEEKGPEKKEKRRKQKKEYTMKHKKSLKEYHKIYVQQNREKINQRRKHRRQTEPQFRLAESLRSRLGGVLRNKKLKKNISTMELTGCTLSFLQNYLEELFEDGMTWENHGKDENCWHIDHIRPCSSFDLSNPEQQKLCFHYTNLQPLWSIENLIKGDTWYPEECGYEIEVCFLRDGKEIELWWLSEI